MSTKTKVLRTFADVAEAMGIDSDDGRPLSRKQREKLERQKQRKAPVPVPADDDEIEQQLNAATNTEEEEDDDTPDVVQPMPRPKFNCKCRNWAGTVEEQAQRRNLGGHHPKCRHKPDVVQPVPAPAPAPVPNTNDEENQTVATATQTVAQPVQPAPTVQPVQPAPTVQPATPQISTAKWLTGLFITASNAVLEHRVKIFAITVMAVIPVIMILSWLLSFVSLAYFMICIGSCVAAYAFIGQQIYDSIRTTASFVVRLKLWVRCAMFMLIATPLILLPSGYFHTWMLVVGLIWVMAEVVGINYRLDRQVSVTVTVEQ